MKEKIQAIKDRFEKVTHDLSKHDVLQDRDRYRVLTKELKDLEPLVNKIDDYLRIVKHIEEDREILNSTDIELKTIAVAEIEELEK